MVRDLIDLEERITRLREDFKKLSEEQKDQIRKDRIAQLTTWLIQNETQRALSGSLDSLFEIATLILLQGHLQKPCHDFTS